jgi:hypothetical protein
MLASYARRFPSWLHRNLSLELSGTELCGGSAAGVMGAAALLERD